MNMADCLQQPLPGALNAGSIHLSYTVTQWQLRDCTGDTSDTTGAKPIATPRLQSQTNSDLIQAPGSPSFRTQMPLSVPGCDLDGLRPVTLNPSDAVTSPKKKCI